MKQAIRSQLTCSLLVLFKQHTGKLSYNFNYFLSIIGKQIESVIPQNIGLLVFLMILVDTKLSIRKLLSEVNFLLLQ